MLRVIRPGLFSTVQDLGRVGFRSRGVPVSGAFDRASAMVANALLGNPPEAAVVEGTLAGGTFVAEIPLALALAGAPMILTLESLQKGTQKLQIPQTISLQAGDRLDLGMAVEGARTYLAVRGGWLTPAILGSRSCETPLKIGDVLPAAPGVVETRRPLQVSISQDFAARLRYLDGPDSHQIVRGSLDDHDYELEASSNRMGLRLRGHGLEMTTDACRLSSPVGPGAIQMPGGLPLILGPACGTMGGYPHVGQVITADLDRLGQLRPGSRVRFLRVGLAEARERDLRSRRQHSACRLRLGSFP